MGERLPNRIREIRKSRGLSQDELAARLGEDVSGATVSRLESGRIALTQSWMERIARELSVMPLELITDRSAPVRLIPVIGMVSAGAWAEAIESPQGFLPVPANVGGPSSFALRPYGDSMNNVADEDEFIVVDPDQLELVAGKAYVVTNGTGEATFKRYRSDPPRLEPDSTNPAHQPTILVGREPFLIVGRVTYATRQL